MLTPVIAIVDVGKTNKKLFLFNQQYEIVWEKTAAFAETVDDDGDPCEDVGLLTKWVLTTIAEVLDLPQFAVQALNFTTYGASLVYLDAEGRQIGHLYNYLKPYPEAIRGQFIEQYDPAGTLSLETASPWLDSLNSGLMLYRIKYDKPRLFRRIWYALHLPQYLSYLITRQMLSDLTSIGCHTMLWDFTNARYHNWVKAEKLDQLMGSLYPGDRAMNALMVQHQHEKTHPLRVGVGLHDSSAALIPYLASFSDRGHASHFVLISTGTWCISMNPFNNEPLTADELAQDCLNYLTYEGQRVKAARLFAGYDHEQQTKQLAGQFNVAPDAYKQVQYNPALIAQLQHPTPPPPADYDTAYHQLMLDLMARQLVSTKLVMPMGHNQPSIRRIFVDGGFSHNPIYMNLLAAAFPDSEVWAASVAQATALGAALAIHSHWNSQPLPNSLITLTHYKAPTL